MVRVDGITLCARIFESLLSSQRRFSVLRIVTELFKTGRRPFESLHPSVTGAEVEQRVAAHDAGGETHQTAVGLLVGKLENLLQQLR